jgi:hypothetical protein
MTQEWIRHHALVIGLAFVVVAELLTIIVAAVFFPHAGHLAVTISVMIVLVVFGAFLAWARTPALTRAQTDAPLTIREHFKRTSVLFRRIFVPIVMAWLGGFTLFATGMSNIERYAWIYGGVVAMCVIAFPFLRSRLICPRCGTNFQQERLPKLGRWSFGHRTAGEIWDRCPRCGVSFDEPYSGI